MKYKYKRIYSQNHLYAALFRRIYKDAEVYNSIFRLGFGFVEVGTITPLKQSGNPKPRVFRLEEDEALINRLGFNNSGADRIQSRIRLNPPKGLFGINIGPNKDTKDRINDYLIGLRKFYELADYLTINISSPNTENLRSFHNESELNDLLQAIEQEKTSLKTSIPTVLKISPDINDQEIEKISKLISKTSEIFLINSFFGAVRLFFSISFKYDGAILILFANSL